jgi:flagella basal body P-ring formation protein FlgA
MIWLIIGGIAGSPRPCIADTIITLHPVVELRHATVKLSDVFDGIPVDGDREIAQAPAPGKSVTYDANVLSRVAQKYHLDWKPRSLADHVVITTASTHVSQDMIRDAVVAHLRESMSVGSAHSIDVAFDNRGLQVDLPVDSTTEFTLNNFAYDAGSKRFRSDLVSQTSAGIIAVPVTGRVTLKRNIPVLVKRLEAGTQIAANDLDTMQVPEERINSGLVTDASQLVGHELRRDINGGEPVRVTDVSQPRFVVRGELVMLRIESPYMTITAQGKALQDGSEGDAVRVVNTQSNRTIEGIVDGRGTVRVGEIQKVATIQ